MTPDSAPSRFSSTLLVTSLFTIALALALPLSTVAQDTNHGDCTVNDKNTIRDCSSEIGSVESTETALSPNTPQDPRLDWVPFKDVPEALRDRQCQNCEGSYIDPLAAENKDTPPEESQLEAQATTTTLEEREVTLSGGASAKQGYRHMRGDTVVVDRIEESITLVGNVILREPGVLLQGEGAEIFSKTGEANLSGSVFVFHHEHIHGSADLLERDSDGLVYMHNGQLSYCAPGEDDWILRADELELDLEEALATARGARIEVEGIPIFYTPWLRFPLDDRRRTGFLWPDFGNDSTGGLDITAPIYFNLAANYDALYAPRWIQKRGLNHELQMRYLNPYIGHWTVGGAYMNNDDRYASQSALEGSNDRWLGVVKQNGRFKERWRSRIDYSKASDVDYIKDLDTGNLDSQRQTSLLQLASMDYLGDQWLLSLQAQQFQSLADDINNDYKKLPQFSAQYRGSRTPFQLEPVILAQYSNFDTEEERVIGERFYGEAGLTYPMLWTYGFLTPTVKYRQLNYKLDDLRVLTDDQPSAGAGLASFDGALFFERPTSFRGKDLTQTLEPRLYYVYSDYEDQSDQPDFDSAELTFTYNQLFRETRFSGRDRLDDANQLSIGITTRFIDNENGKNLLSASIGQIYYFRDRQVRLKALEAPLDDSRSELAGELEFTPNDNLSLRTSLIYDPFSGNMNAAHFQTSYEADHGELVNFGYSFRRPRPNGLIMRKTEELSASFYLPLGNKWTAFAAANYSLVDDKSVEDMFGVEYDSCCWTVRLLHLRYFNNVSGQLVDLNDPELVREDTTQFQIILKGMGGYGDRITQIMEDMIRGFEERDH
jgi:LPS-assembly protein